MPFNLPAFERLINEAPPETLYHYTTATGLSGILRSRRLWASSLQFLNDAQELKHAQSVLRQALDEHAGLPSVHEDVRSVCRWLSEKLDRVESLDACAFSLSQWGDLLSQWRAYCPPPGGYSIGFRYSDLRTIAERHGVVFGRCLYRTDAQREVVQELIGNIQRGVLSVRPDTEKRGEDFAALFLPVLLFQFSKVAPFLKHGSFEEEAEWRLVYPSPNIDQVPLDVRISTSRLIPHATVDFRDSGLPQPIAEIIVGPCPDPLLSERAVAILLKGVGLDDVTHRKSWASYRMF